MHSDFCPVNTSCIPSRDLISRGTDADLDKAYEQWEADYENACCEDHENRCAEILAWIEAEQDARELWNSDDDRIRESVGNYRSHLS